MAITGLAPAALRMALAARSPCPGGLIHHSDRGDQYACGNYCALLAAQGIQPRLSRIGSPYDSAKAESFMKTLTQEEIDGRAYRDADEAHRSIGAFIDGFTIASGCTRRSRTWPRSSSRLRCYPR